MEPLVLALVLLAALLHALWNALLKSGEDRVLVGVLLNLGASALALPVALAAGPPRPESWLYLGLSIVVHNGYFWLLILAYRVGDLSHVYPLARGSAPLLVAGLAYVAAALRGRAAFAAWRTSWRAGLLSAVLAVSGYGLVIWAMSRAPIPHVSALRETSVVIAALNRHLGAGRALRRPPRRRRGGGDRGYRAAVFGRRLRGHREAGLEARVRHPGPGSSVSRGPCTAAPAGACNRGGFGATADRSRPLLPR